jgi:flavin reductase (DIM6/NTAB) family NADH-FMN oxidoreductase RutF
MDPLRHIDPSALTPQDRYKLLTGAIVPRPIAWVSTTSPSGRLNLAPFSFFCGVGSNPMTLAFCPANKPDGTEKDTLRNAKPAAEGGTGECVVNVVPHALGPQMAACAVELPFGESEFDFARLTTRPSAVVRPPGVSQSPLSFECRTMQVIRTNPGVPGGGNLILAQVVHIVATSDLVNDRLHVDPALLDAIGRMGGSSYSTTRERFDLPFGRPPT